MVSFLRIAIVATTASAVRVRTQQPPCFMRIFLVHRKDRAPSEKVPEFGLLWRPADLGDYRRRNERNNAKLQTDPVFSLRVPLVCVGCNESGVVADDVAHAERRTVREFRSCATTLLRSFNSSAAKRPCCFSNSATAAKPARRCSASPCDVVIRAEMLTRSREPRRQCFCECQGL